MYSWIIANIVVPPVFFVTPETDAEEFFQDAELDDVFQLSASFVGACYI
jgi:hypothetical protein